MGGIAALVVAAGRGQRFGGARPKQYAPLAGKPVLRYSLEALTAHPAIDRVVTVIHPDDRPLYDAAADGLPVLEPVHGGASRQQSVHLGLEALAPHGPEQVLIHDGARPFLDPGLIDRVLTGLAAAPGAIAALPVTDTLKRGDGNSIRATVERQGLWRAQTPQGFAFSGILAAHRAIAEGNGPELTDDAAVAEQAGLEVRLVDGSTQNLKVTTPDDLLEAERRVSGGYMPRIGQGFDVHRFAAGDRVTLCGVDIPFTQRLSGHSDADVGLHALTDAILGAIGAGDIGSHFPPSDPQWQGADSAIFLRHAAELVAARGGQIGNLDVTLICEAPKIGPHRPAMVARLAELLALPAERISVKATTTEKLGFTGRGEGIAAQAIVTLLLPSSTPSAPA